MASQHCLIHGTILGTGVCTCAPMVRNDDSDDSKKRGTDTRPGANTDARDGDGEPASDSDDDVPARDTKRTRRLKVDRGVSLGVVAQFLELDGMRAGIYPQRPWVPALEAYIANVPMWRASPLPQAPAPVLRLVLHTGASRLADRPVGVGHYIAVEIVAAGAGYTFRYMDSLDGAPDRRPLIQAFIQRYLP